MIKLKEGTQQKKTKYQRMARSTRGNRDHMPRPLKKHVIHLTLLAPCFQLYIKQLSYRLAAEIRNYS